MVATLPEVLVIDDNKVDRALVRRFLRGHYEVREATTAAEGLAAVARSQPHCILLDYHLPDRDGLTLIPALLEHRVPVIMLTGQGAEETAVAAVKAGASDYFVKGRLDRDALRRAIAYAIETRALQSTVTDQAQEIRGKEAQLFRFLDVLPIGVYVLDRQGRPYFANQAAVRILGQGAIPASAWRRSRTPTRPT